MIKSTRNQCGNAKNPYQGKTKKVLCVCSAGLLRSPTTAKYLTTKYGYNTRACGVSEEYALVPISTALILWSDEIVFAEDFHYLGIKQYLDECEYEGRITVLNIPDQYSYDAPEIYEFLDEKYEEDKC